MEITGLKVGLASVVLIAGGGAFVGIGFMQSSINTCQSPSPSPSTTVVNPKDVSLVSGGIPIIPNTVTGEKIPLTGETLTDAELIAGIGFALQDQLAAAHQPKLTDSDIAVAEMTSMGEARLLNLNYGDASSGGMFQQQSSIVSPSTGIPYWGTAAQVRNPIYSSNRFYKELLMRKAQALANGEGTLAPAVLAQRIQASGNPAGYAPWWPQAVAIVQALKPAKDGVATIAQISDAATSADAAMADTCQGVTGTTTPDTTSGPSSAEGWHVPLAGNFIITQGYTWNGSTGHPGVDLSGANIYGRPILAAADGVVESHLPNPYGYGNYVELGHAGNIETIYGHMAQIAPGIIPGVQVKAGQVLGYVDSTGDSTGNHLHFEVLINGVRVNALTFMLQRGINLANYGATALAA